MGIRRRLAVLLLSLVLISVFHGASMGAERIRCASTTSTQNSGLFDYLLPLFQKKTGIRVDVIAVGTGAALQIGKRGDVDVVLVHSKEDELRMLREGWFVNRQTVMYNWFVLVGPPEDPAGVRGVASVVEAFRRIFEKGARFISRGDNSGTHKRELKIWQMAGLSPKGHKWYMEVGQGMAKTLRIASQLGGYTLTDKGTYLALMDHEDLNLSVLLEGDRVLLNEYGVMAVNPDRHPHVRYREAMRFIEWLVSEEAQKAIGSYRDSKGNQLFFPANTEPTQGGMPQIKN